MSAQRRLGALTLAVQHTSDSEEVLYTAARFDAFIRDGTVVPASEKEDTQTPATSRRARRNQGN